LYLHQIRENNKQDNITQSFTYNGKTRTEPLELDAQELYGLSQ
jgi:hypothetical protein